MYPPLKECLWEGVGRQRSVEHLAAGKRHVAISRAAASIMDDDRAARVRTAADSTAADSNA